MGSIVDMGKDCVVHAKTDILYGLDNAESSHAGKSAMDYAAVAQLTLTISWAFA
jgi:hypothetical protein